MVKINFKIAKPTEFSFERTVTSHGWCGLQPFALDRENWILDRVFRLENHSPVFAQISNNQTDIKILIKAESEIDESNRAKITGDAKRILQLDENFADFYQLLANEPDFVWIAKTNSGRLLRSPTVFEDLVKSICTTNCSWALTKIMTANLVQKLGAATGDDLHKDFPTAQTMAAQSTEFFKNEIRAGYRSEYLRELAIKVADGKLDVESWLNHELPTPELKKQMKTVKGVGDYAAENLLKLLGRYDGLALDSYLRGQFAKKYNDGEKCADTVIQRHYERFGAWRGLVLWCDMTKN